MTKPTPASRPLNPRQSRYVDEYLTTGKARDAAEWAGRRRTAAWQAGPASKRLPDFRTAIKAGIAAMAGAEAAWLGALDANDCEAPTEETPKPMDNVVTEPCDGPAFSVTEPCNGPDETLAESDTAQTEKTGPETLQQAQAPLGRALGRPDAAGSESPLGRDLMS